MLNLTLVVDAFRRYIPSLIQHADGELILSHNSDSKHQCESHESFFSAYVLLCSYLRWIGIPDLKNSSLCYIGH